MKYLQRALVAEFIKVRKTLGMWSAIIAPIFMVSINFLIFYNRPELFEEGIENPWLQFTMFSINSWSVLMMPLFITLLTFYVNYTEHRASGWKFIYSLPLPKLSVYSAKFIICLVIFFFTMFLYYVFNLIAIQLFASIYPQVPFDSYGETFTLFVVFNKLFLASIAIMSIQFFVSLLVSNFVFPIGFGVFATIANATLLRWEHSHFIPYAYPFFSINKLFAGLEDVFLSESVILSLLVGSAFLIGGYLVHWRVNIK